MRQTKSLRNFLLFSCSLLLFACAGTPAQHPQLFDNVFRTPEPTAVPGSLLDAEALDVIPAKNTQQVLAVASPFVIGTQLKMGVLNNAGYAAWRQSRLGTLRDIQPIRIGFTARLPEGGSERQSGTIFLPAARAGEGRQLTWLIFAKGTELRREYTPSRGKGLEMPFITGAAALGYAVWVPDYSGMGDSTGSQEYCVAESLADSALDGLAAARQWMKQATVDGKVAYEESGRLAIIGYSEGGLTVMGALKAIADQRIPVPGLRLAAVYAMGAPLNLAISISELGITPFVLTHPEFQVFLALGWKRVYPDNVKLDAVFLTRTIAKIVPLFDGTRSDTDVNREIARIVGKKAGTVTDSDIFAPDYLSALRRDPASTPYYRVQELTRLDRWTPPPGIPIILAATPTDDIVPFSNSSNEYAWIKENAPQADVTLVRLASADHISAGVEAYLFSMVDLEKREALSRKGLEAAFPLVASGR